VTNSLIVKVFCLSGVALLSEWTFGILFFLSMFGAGKGCLIFLSLPTKDLKNIGWTVVACNVSSDL
jgi:hypothetical protein